MGRLLAIDYGNKRTGLAVSDPLKIIANALTTIPTHELFTFLMKYVVEEQVERFVVGLPLQTNGKPSESSKFVEPFVRKLAQTFPNIPIERIDERFTSVIAQQTILASGIGKKARQDKSLADKLSATIILQSYMQRL
jgi:putative holliday junction resolvase